MKLGMKESEETGPTLADIDNLNKQEQFWRQELAYYVDNSSLSESQLEDFLRIDIDDNIPSEDAGYFVEDINKYFNGNFANIESIEYLENKKWCPVLGLKEVEDEFQFRFEGVTKYSFRDGNVRYIGWGGQDSTDVTDYFLSHQENTDLVGYVLKDDDDNIITPTVSEDVAMLDAVQFLNKEDAIAYAESHPEVCIVAEVYGPDLSLTSDIAWSRIWHQPPLAGLIESKKNIKGNKMESKKKSLKLKENYVTDEQREAALAKARAIHNALVDAGLQDIDMQLERFISNQPNEKAWYYTLVDGTAENFVDERTDEDWRQYLIESKNLKESVILHFDLEDGTHKALPFDSEEDALEYMDSDAFPIGEWVGSYDIETVKEPKKEKPKATEEDYEFQVLEPEDIEKLDELVKEIKDHNEDGWCDWVDYAIKVGRKYLGESLARYGEGEYTPFEDLIDECETFVYYRTTVIDKLLNKRLALQKELEQMKESTNLKESTFESYWTNGNADALKKRFHEICSELGVWTKDDKGCENFGLYLRVGHSVSDENDIRLSIVSPKYYLADSGNRMWANPNSTEDFDKWVTEYVKKYSWLFEEKDSDAYKHLVKSENPEPWNTFVANEGRFRKALSDAFKSPECKYITLDDQYDTYGEVQFEVDSVSGSDDELAINMTWEDRSNPDGWIIFKFDGDLNYTATMNGETVTGQSYEDAAKQYVLRIANKYAEGEFAKEYEPECYELRVYLRQDFYTKASKNIWQSIESILEGNCGTYTNYQPEDWVDDRAAVWTSVEVDDLKRVLEWLKKRRSAPRIEIWDENKNNVTSQFWTPKVEESTKKFTEAVVTYTNDIGEATAYELNQQVRKTLGEYGYSFGGNQSERPVCAPKKYYLQDRNFDGHTTYLLSVKGEYYDEIIIQICDSRVCGMANYTIRSPEGVLWMGQTPKEFIEDINDMTTGYNEM